MSRSSCVRLFGVLGFAILGAHALPTVATAQQAMSPDAKKYLKQVLDKMREYGLRRDEIGWRDLENKAMAAVPNAQTIADTYPGIQLALNVIADKRAAYKSASGQLMMADVPGCVSPATVSEPVLPANIGYLKLTPPTATNAGSLSDAAMRIQADIKKIDAAGATAWIVDLRSFDDGNFAAPIIGVAPLLGEGIVMYSINMLREQTPYTAGDDRIYSDDIPIRLTTPKVSLIHKKPKVAVLIGPATAGAGETIAIAFTGRREARTFGMPTCGLSPYAARPVDLSDGAKLYSTGIIIADRFHKPFFGPLQPDEKIENADALIASAIKWLTAGN